MTTKQKRLIYEAFMEGESDIYVLVGMVHGFKCKNRDGCFWEDDAEELLKVIRTYVKDALV